MKTLGLIGKTLQHSFSQNYFTKKFLKEKIEGYQYQLFPLACIEDFPKLLADQPTIVGLNVTIPYKEVIIPYLDEIDTSAKFGAVNTIKLVKKRLIGYNTDVFGFANSIKKLTSPKSNALILGTGGAAKAVAQALESLEINYTFVSRTPTEKAISYQDLNATLVTKQAILINATPLGTYPNPDACPDIPYHLLSSKQLLVDLVYNPALTTFLQKGAEQGCSLKNGLEMLQLQAEKAWDIWREEG